MGHSALLNRKREGGQTLVIVLIIMFVLVTLGFVVMLVLGREITATGVARERNISDDLSQAGIRYSYSQLRFSEKGADWRPDPPQPVPADVNPNLPPGLGPNSDPENLAATNPDPDYFWLRRQGIPGNADPNDRGGPDGLGCFTRLNYDTGRTLVRVVYVPSSSSMFTPAGGVNAQKAKLRAYTIVQAIGRPGAFNALDPTSARRPDPQNYRELAAIVPIGILESAYYVTDKEERNQAAPLGNPIDFGASFNGVPVKVRRKLGGDVATSPGGIRRTLGAPIYINSSAVFHGNMTDPAGASGMEIYLNEDLGDQVLVAGPILFAESGTPVILQRISGGTVTPLTPQASASPNFNSFRGLFRDNRESTDGQGFPRGTPRKEPPLVDETDPNTGQIRYRYATRDSGIVGPSNFNTGRLGYGRGIFIGNNDDLNRDSEDGTYSQRTDMLNPNKHPDGFWQGPYYIPPAVYIELRREGFTITRNIENDDDTWRFYTGQDSGRHTLRFKLGQGSGVPGDIRIINEFTPGVTNFGSPSQADFAQGLPFNGLIFAEGNVRVRGVIPTVDTGRSARGIQVTVVSLGTGFVEGSILKSTETCMFALLCRENVAINTSQFVGSGLSNTLQVVRDNTDPTSPARLRVDSGHNFDALVQFPPDPLAGLPTDPLYSFNNPNRNQSVEPINISLWMAHAADFNHSAFINLLLNAPFGPDFLFENQDPPNAAAQFFAPGPPIATYGLADPGSQVLPIYEKRRFEIFPYMATAVSGGANKLMTLKLDNTIAAPGRGDYYFSRLSVAPLDVRIEAALYAQEGSLYVLPSPWMNPNPNDRRDSFTTSAERFNAFQAAPEYPFYAEPVDIKVTIIGSVSENFPASIADQSLWLQHWGWIPAEFGESGQYVPDQHFPRIPGTNNPDYTNSLYVPNLSINYDPTMVSGRPGGTFDQTVPMVRRDEFGRSLPPIPRLPVGTKLLYFGEVNP
ncbi:MAG: hypothetical protein M3R13_08110 [Armatimonadota bacterium]|nr:hypothetical protein [Armatimonadota bacterium]